MNEQEIKEFYDMAIGLIRNWHDMGMPEDQSDTIWAIYEKNAPEIKRFKEKYEAIKALMQQPTPQTDATHDLDEAICDFCESIHNEICNHKDDCEYRDDLLLDIKAAGWTSPEDIDHIAMVRAMNIVSDAGYVKLDDKAIEAVAKELYNGPHDFGWSNAKYTANRIKEILLGGKVSGNFG